MLFICEKPMVADNIHDYTNLSFQALFSNSFMYEFDYSDYSFKSNPSYKIRENMKKFYASYRLINNNKIKVADFLLHSDSLYDKFLYLSDFDEICFFLERDHSSVRSFDILFNVYSKVGDGKMPITSMFVYDGQYDSLNIKKHFSNRKICNSEFVNQKTIQNYRNAYLLKDYIDYNFNFLMLKKFSISLTRNMIWALCLQHELYKQNDLSMSKLIMILTKYNVGSPASRHQIVKALENYSFLETKENEKYFLSKNGVEFVEKYSKILCNKDYFQNFFNDFKSFEKGYSTYSIEEVKMQIDEYFDQLVIELKLDM